MTDCVGQQLGNYRLVRLLGQGGSADVYLGEHIYLKTQTAIKILRVRLVDDALKSFLREARMVASLEHPHIVRVLEFGIERETPYLVMNYATQGTLRQRYPRGTTLPAAIIISLVKQVASALQYAHSNGVIHRDIKPENMLVVREQDILLSDFGLAIVAQSMQMTGVGELPGRAGTTAYMAPEQLRGEPSRASDQYSLGTVVYEWFCGSRPFVGSDHEMIIQQQYMPPPSMQTKVATISSAIDQVVMKALSKEAQARYATVQDFANALEEACLSTALYIAGTATLSSQARQLRPPTETLVRESATAKVSEQNQPEGVFTPGNDFPAFSDDHSWPPPQDRLLAQQNPLRVPQMPSLALTDSQVMSLQISPPPAQVEQIPPVKEARRNRTLSRRSLIVAALGAGTLATGGVILSMLYATQQSQIIPTKPTVVKHATPRPGPKFTVQIIHMPHQVSNNALINVDVLTNQAEVQIMLVGIHAGNRFPLGEQKSNQQGKATIQARIPVISATKTNTIPLLKVIAVAINTVGLMAISKPEFVQVL